MNGSSTVVAYLTNQIVRGGRTKKAVVTAANVASFFIGLILATVWAASSKVVLDERPYCSFPVEFTERVLFDRVLVCVGVAFFAQVFFYFRSFQGYNEHIRKNGALSPNHPDSNSIQRRAMRMLFIFAMSYFPCFIEKIFGMCGIQPTLWVQVVIVLMGKMEPTLYCMIFLESLKNHINYLKSKSARPLTVKRVVRAVSITPFPDSSAPTFTNISGKTTNYARAQNGRYTHSISMSTQQEDHWTSKRQALEWNLRRHKNGTNPTNSA